MTYGGPTCQEIQDVIAAMLLERPLANSSAMSDVLLLAAVNWAVRELQRRHDWQAMRTTLDSVSTVQGQAYVDLPSSFKKMAPGFESEGCVFRLDGDSWVRVPMVYNGQLLDLPRLRRMYADPTETGEPERCCVEGRRIYVGPTPDAQYDLRIPCVAFTADLGADERNWFTENLEEAIVEGGTARACFWIHQEEEAARRFARFYHLIDQAYAVDAYEIASRTGPRTSIPAGWRALPSRVHVRRTRSERRGAAMFSIRAVTSTA